MAAGSRKFGEANRSFCICVDTYDRGVMAGRCVHPMLRDGAFEFQSLTQLLIRLETRMDEMQFPQSFTQKRVFMPIEKMSPEGMPEDVSAGEGKLATFRIRILFRQHASWQGTVTWVEGSGEQTFRSVLELILLMDSALSGV